jgi:hypothetical protein
MGILCDRNILRFINGTAKKPAVSDPVKDGKAAKVTTWEGGDSRAQTQLELTLSDMQIVHIMGAKSAEEMWKQLMGLQQLYAKGMVEGLIIDDPTQPFQQCKPCIQAKQHCQSFMKEAKH